MKITGFFIVITLSSITYGNLLFKLQEISKPIDQNQIEAKECLIKDVIDSRSNDSIVLVTGLDYLRVEENNTPALISLQSGFISEQLLENLKVLNVKLNRRSFYIILPSHLDNLEDLFKLVKNHSICRL